jgi:hypothetical protein
MKRTSWLERLSESLDQAVGEGVRTQVMQGHEDLTSGSAPGTKARWICEMLDRLEKLGGEEASRQVMTACHCPFPQPLIRRLRTMYEKAHQIDVVVDALQAERRESLHQRVGADEFLWEQARKHAFFNSPIRDGNTVIHIAAPYHPWGYLRETDLQKQRGEYCHCGWINGSKELIPQAFCYCGAGYYKALWEGVLEVPVEVAVLRSIFNGDPDCRVQITLAAGVF